MASSLRRDPADGPTHTCAPVQTPSRTSFLSQTFSAGCRSGLGEPGCCFQAFRRYRSLSSGLNSSSTHSTSCAARCIVTTTIVFGRNPPVLGVNFTFFFCFTFLLVEDGSSFADTSRSFRKSNGVPRYLIGAAQRCTLGNFTRPLSSQMSVFLTSMTSPPPPRGGERSGAERPNTLAQLANLACDHKLNTSAQNPSDSRRCSVTTSWRAVGHAGDSAAGF